MRDPHHTKLAAVLVEYSAAVRRGDLVTIVAEPEALPMVEALFEAVLRAGGHPSFHPRSESLREVLLREGSTEQLQHVSPFERHRLAHCDVLLVLNSPLNTRVLARSQPERLATLQAARAELMTLSMQRAARGDMRYVLVELPTLASAQEAERSLAEHEAWIYAAGKLDSADPVGEWRRLHEQQERVCRRLRACRELRIESPAGTAAGRPFGRTELTIDVAGRSWVNSAGAENFPDGEVFSGPVSVDGVFCPTFPAVYQGQVVEGIRLVLEGGRVTDATAAINERFLLAMIDQDPGARVVGEVGIGTNYAITEHIRNTFFDEKIGGTFHLALGSGYPQTGSTNRSGLHWDIVSDLRSAQGTAHPGGTIHADGELIQSSGRFLVPGWPGS